MATHQMLLVGASAFTASPSFYAPLTNTLAPTTAPGGSGLSFGRASTAYVPDWENVLRLALSGEARFTGARRVANLVTKSEALTNAAWLLDHATMGTGISDPLGGTTAFTLTATAANGNTYQAFTGLATTQTRVSSCWIKRRTGSGNIALYAGGSQTNITGVDSTWRRFSLSSAAAATSYFGVLCVTSGDAVDIWHPQHEDVTGQSNQNPGEYVSTGLLSTPFQGAAVDGVQYFATLNGNTVSTNIVTEATGAAITSSNGSAVTCDATGPFGLLIEESRTAIIGNPEAFGSWTLTRATVTSNNQAGPNGFSTADTLNEDSNTNSHFCYLNAVKAASAITYTATCYVKQSGRNWVDYQVTDGATGYCETFFNVNTGVVGTNNVAGGFVHVASTIEAAANGFYRIRITCTSTIVALIQVVIATSDGDNDGSTVGLNGAALILWGNQLEVGAFPTSQIPTGVSNRPYDGMSYSTFTTNASATVGTAYAETKVLWTTAIDVYPLVSFGVATLYPLYNNTEAATVIRTNDGTNNVGKTGMSSMNTAARKVASSWTGSTLAVTGGGATAATGTFDGNMGSTAIGVGNPTTGSGLVWNGTIRNLKLYTSAATAAQLKTLTT